MFLIKKKKTAFLITKNRRQKKIANGKSKRFFLNAGAIDNLQKGAVIRIICSNAGISADKIGHIEILREFSFFEIETSVAAKVLKSMKVAKLDGRSIRVQYAEDNKSKAKPFKKSRKKRSAQQS